MEPIDIKAGIVGTVITFLLGTLYFEVHPFGAAIVAALCFGYYWVGAKTVYAIQSWWDRLWW
ncbi:hypothetical protein ACU8OL_34700 (plasmid) [Rhizobium leguminosarum]